jgi:hypothetical protein
LKPSELHLFVGEKFILTITREKDNPAVDKAISEFRDLPDICERGPMYAVYLLTEDLIETYFPVVEKLEDDADLSAVLAGVAGKETLRGMLSHLQPKEEVLLLGWGVPMPIPIRSRRYDDLFWQEVLGKNPNRKETIEDLTRSIGF